MIEAWKNINLREDLQVGGIKIKGKKKNSDLIKEAIRDLNQGEGTALNQFLM